MYPLITTSRNQPICGVSGFQLASGIKKSQSECVSGLDPAPKHICVTGVASRRYLFLTDPNSGMNVNPPATVNVFRILRGDRLYVKTVMIKNSLLTLGSSKISPCSISANDALTL